MARLPHYRQSTDRDLLELVITQQSRIINLVERIQEQLKMSTQDIETEIGVIAADLATVSTGVTAIAAALAAAQAASGDGSISAADAATILTQLQGVDASAKAVVTALNAAVPPAPAPAPTPAPPASS